MPDSNKIPDGFFPAKGRGPFTQHNGPIYRRYTDDRLEVGMLVLERHCNGLGFLHGGMAAAFADGALAAAVWQANDQASVTMKLSMDYLQSVRRGDWLVTEPQIVGQSGQIVHVRAELYRSESQIACQATGVFHLLRRNVN